MGHLKALPFRRGPARNYFRRAYYRGLGGNRRGIRFHRRNSKLAASIRASETARCQRVDDLVLAVLGNCEQQGFCALPLLPFAEPAPSPRHAIAEVLPSLQRGIGAGPTRVRRGVAPDREPS